MVELAATCERCMTLSLRSPLAMARRTVWTGPCGFTSLEQEQPSAFDLYFPYTSKLEVKQSREFLISGAAD